MPVYLVRHGADGLVKIGFSGSVHARIANMQTGFPEPLTVLRILDGAKELEAALHARFASHRVRGEWFMFHNDMMGDLGAPDLMIKRPRVVRERIGTPWSPEQRARVSKQRLAFYADPEKHAAYLEKAGASRLRRLRLNTISEVAARAGGWTRFAAALDVPAAEIMTWTSIPIRYLEAAAVAARVPVTKLAALAERPDAETA